MGRPSKFDFSGYVTRYDVLCSDGRTIKPKSFAEQDGMTVPLVYNHDHKDINNVIGQVYLEHRDQGMYGYGTFNDTDNAVNAKKSVIHKDITSMSIFANKLVQDDRKNVTHGIIREVSLVLAGANPGAFIDNIMVHSEDENSDTDYVESEDQAIIYNDDSDGIIIHSEESNAENQNEESNAENKTENKTESNDNASIEHSEEESSFSNEFIKSIEGKSVNDVIDGLKISTDEKKFIYSAIGNAYEIGMNENKEGNKSMKHNVFENGDNNTNTSKNYIFHSEDQKKIISLAKNKAIVSLSNAVKTYFNENEELAHSDCVCDEDGNVLMHSAVYPFGENTDSNPVSYLFPEYTDVSNGNPEVIRNRIDYVDKVLSGVHSSPAAFIKTHQIDERVEELRAMGYIRGDEKSRQAARKVLGRRTSPQTIYVSNTLDRDEWADIESFDELAYLKREDEVHLRQELADAILIGDGREANDKHKIEEDRIRPIWLDNSYYTIRAVMDVAATRQQYQGSDATKYFGDNFINSKAMLKALYDARVNFRGTGTPALFCSDEAYSWFALATDRAGHDLYSSEEAIRAKLKVSSIQTVYKFTNKTRVDETTGKTYKLVGIVVDLNDYVVGANKKGKLTHFDQFDIDFNQMKTLTETRLCGALRSPLTAIAIEVEVTNDSEGETTNNSDAGAGAGAETTPVGNGE